MKLHHNIKLYSDTLRAASQHLNIKLDFVEKDYWISLILRRLAESEFAEMTVFKGGTSLTKGYNLIERFSEDIDIAVINNKVRSGNEIKNFIRTVEKKITSDLKELEMKGVTSKGSRFRKTVFEYVCADKSNKNNKLIVEINAFANSVPFQPLTIGSFVYDFLSQSGNTEYIELYDLQEFRLNVLAKEQTLLEKIVALIRFSYSENIIESISSKIRHFYDIYFLMQDDECSKFAASDSFKKQFDAILQYDREAFDEPNGWQTKSLSESPLIIEFSSIWGQIKGKYQTELTVLSYRPIPNEREVYNIFKELLIRLH